MDGATSRRQGEREPGRAGAESAPVVFRPTLWLRASVVAAVAVWVGVFFLLVSFRGSPDGAFLSVAFFITFFTILGVFYNNTSIEVTDFGVIVREVTSFRLVPFSDIVRVDVKPGLLQTTYAVAGRSGLVVFSSLFSGHRRLMQLIVERSKLGRL